MATLVIHLVGLTLVLACRHDREWLVPLWSVFALVNGFSMWMFIESNGHFYS